MRRMFIGLLSLLGLLVVLGLNRSYIFGVEVASCAYGAGGG